MLSVQRIFPENEKPYDQKEHIRNEGKSLAERGVNLATSTAKPVIPPNVKLLANLKK